MELDGKRTQQCLCEKSTRPFWGLDVRFKGMEVNFTMKREAGKRLNSIKVKGTALSLTQSYTVVACERNGDPGDVLCRIENVKDAHNEAITLHTIVSEYLAEFSPVAPKIEGRLTATDLPHNLLSQLDGYEYEFN